MSETTEATTETVKTIIYISLEYCFNDLFSGNGILARNQVEALSSYYNHNNEATSTTNNDKDKDNKKKHYCIRQHVITARPIEKLTNDGKNDATKIIKPFTVDKTNKDMKETYEHDLFDNVVLHIIPVKKWKTTDRYSDYVTFQNGVSEIVTKILQSGEEEEGAEDSTNNSNNNNNNNNIMAILTVDWTGILGIQSLSKGVQEKYFSSSSTSATSSSSSSIPIFFLNFRVYSKMTNISKSDQEFYHHVEKSAINFILHKTGGGIMALCDTDLMTLQSMNEKEQDAGQEEDQDDSSKNSFITILPMLRTEFATIAMQDRDEILEFNDNNNNNNNGPGSRPRRQINKSKSTNEKSRKRKYFVCLVRLSKDKGPQRFVNVCERITKREPKFWYNNDVIPVMVGAASQPEFAKELKERFRQVMTVTNTNTTTKTQTKTSTVCYAKIVNEFLTPKQLSDEILKQSLLNFHPALYEAFGMTIVEAGSCGVPTMIHQQQQEQAQTKKSSSSHDDNADNKEMTNINCDNIGAAALLSPTRGEAIAVPMEDTDKVVERVMDLLRLRKRSDENDDDDDDDDGYDDDDDYYRNEELTQVGHKAYYAATSWTARPHVEKLWSWICTITDAQQKKTN